MKSPKQIDDEVVEEFGITPEIDLNTEFKIAYLKAQIEEFKKMLFRSRVDIILSEKLMTSEVEALAEKGRTNRTENRHNAKQFARGLETLNQYLKELDETRGDSAV